MLQHTFINSVTDTQNITDVLVSSNKYASCLSNRSFEEVENVYDWEYFFKSWLDLKTF